MNDIEKFKFWSHKVLPLVYDDSLSYYEFLCKVLKKLNEVIDLTTDQNNVIAEANKKEQAFENSANTKYEQFTNAINAKIDEFMETETLSRTQYESSISDQFNNFFNRYIQTLGIVQGKGNSTTEVMSQKSVTDEFANGVPENKLFYHTTVFDEMQQDNSFVRGKFLNASNTTAEVTQAYMSHSDYITVVGGSILHFNLRVYQYNNKAQTAVCAIIYDNNKSIIDKIYTLSSTPEWVWHNEYYTLPKEAKYIRFNYTSDSRASSNTKAYGRQFICIAKENGYAKYYNDGDYWCGKKLLAFGDSITDFQCYDTEQQSSGKYLKYIANYGGMLIDNNGIAGATICSGSHLIRDKILSTTTENLMPYDIITIQGFVNDFGGNAPIGEYSDNTIDTFCGCLNLCITHIQNHSRAKIVLITTSTGTAGTRYLLKNNQNATIFDYNKAIKTVGNYNGVEVIEAGENCEINMYHTEYLHDNIHHNEKGGEQYANTIWNVLKNVKPCVIGDIADKPTNIICSVYSGEFNPNSYNYLAETEETTVSFEVARNDKTCVTIYKVINGVYNKIENESTIDAGENIFIVKTSGYSNGTISNNEYKYTITQI